MFRYRNFIVGFFLSAIFLGGIAVCLQFSLRKIGELDIQHVIDAQILSDRVLFLSGVNQKTFTYKLGLAKAVNPKIVLIGSSRAMQVRGEFFSKKFFNYGGAVNSIYQLEAIARSELNSNNDVETAIIFLDPWWFNGEFVGKNSDPPMDSYPKFISAGLIWEALALLKKGNWIVQSFDSHNLGIQAILTNSGYASDGSFYETEVASGKRNSIDQKFLNTLQRIKYGDQRFEKSNYPDSDLVSRACNAVNLIFTQVPNVILVFPPFASEVWDTMQKDGGYGYIGQVSSQLKVCNSEIQLYDYSSIGWGVGGSDCEFMDGFHGGDVVNARLLQALGGRSQVVKNAINDSYLSKFISKNVDSSNGMVREKYPSISEVDYLKLGCRRGGK